MPLDTSLDTATAGVVAPSSDTLNPALPGQVAGLTLAA